MLNSIVQQPCLNEDSKAQLINCVKDQLETYKQIENVNKLTNKMDDMTNNSNLSNNLSNSLSSTSSNTSSNLPISMSSSLSIDLFRKIAAKNTKTTNNNGSKSNNMTNTSKTMFKIS